jgi:hypothetical protein
MPLLRQRLQWIVALSCLVRHLARAQCSWKIASDGELAAATAAISATSCADGVTLTFEAGIYTLNTPLQLTHGPLLLSAAPGLAIGAVTLRASSTSPSQLVSVQSGGVDATNIVFSGGSTSAACE